MAEAVVDQDILDYSTNELFDEMVDKDPAVEIVGYVESIEGRKQCKSYFLFKFVLTNGQKRVTCLIWGDELINVYQNEIRIGRIVCLDGAKSKATVLTQSRRQEGFIAFELIIQINTSVTYHGQHRQLDVPVEQPPQEVTFEEIGLAEGRLVIEGFIKTVFTHVPSQYGNMSYGSGSITDGVFKVTVQVSNFIPVPMQKGQAVRVTGVLSGEGSPLRIECRTMGDITLLEDREPMGLQQLLRAVRTPRRERVF